MWLHVVMFREGLLKGDFNRRASKSLLPLFLVVGRSMSGWESFWNECLKRGWDFPIKVPHLYVSSFPFDQEYSLDKKSQLLFWWKKETENSFVGVAYTGARHTCQVTAPLPSSRCDCIETYHWSSTWLTRSSGILESISSMWCCSWLRGQAGLPGSWLPYSPGQDLTGSLTVIKKFSWHSRLRLISRHQTALRLDSRT